MTRRLGASVAAGLAAVVVVAGAAVAQPKNNIGEPLAKVFLANGCIMTDAAAAKALMAQGDSDPSDLQAQEKSLYKGGYLMRDGTSLRLTNWGACK